MNSNSKLSYAIAAILAAVRRPDTRIRRGGVRRRNQFRRDSGDHRDRAAAHGEHAGRADPIQALTGETLKQLNVATFDDYIKYLPNVTTANNGPGQNEIFMRGLSAGSQASQGSGSTGVVPERRNLPG